MIHFLVSRWLLFLNLSLDQKTQEWSVVYDSKGEGMANPCRDDTKRFSVCDAQGTRWELHPSQLHFSAKHSCTQAYLGAHCIKGQLTMETDSVEWRARDSRSVLYLLSGRWWTLNNTLFVILHCGSKGGFSCLSRWGRSGLSWQPDHRLNMINGTPFFYLI